MALEELQRLVHVAACKTQGSGNDRDGSQFNSHTHTCIHAHTHAHTHARKCHMYGQKPFECERAQRVQYKVTEEHFHVTLAYVAQLAQSVV